MLRCHRLFKVTALGIVLSVAATTTASATPETWDVLADPTNGFDGLTSSWSLSDPDSAYAAWNVFDAYPVDATPDAGSFGLGSASLTENTGAAIITGGGNLYSFSGPTDFTLELSGATSGSSGGLRTVGLRIESLGTVLDLSSVTVTLGVGGAILAPTASAIVFEDIVGGTGGDEQELVFVWEGVADGDYLFDFASTGPHMSLSQVASYMSPVPEPGTALLMGLGLGGLTLAGRKRS